MHYIYRITNLINQKIYIGQSKNTNVRWHQHKIQARCNKPSQIVNRSMKKYGIENFKFEVVASCLDQEAANKTEEIIIKQHKSYQKEFGYNISLGGCVAPKSEEWKQHMSRLMSEKAANGQLPNLIKNSPFVKGRIVSQEIREKQRVSMTGKYIGRHHTDETKEKCRQANIGRIVTKESKEKNRQAHLGKPRGPITICSAENCNTRANRFINDTKYCNKHGLRLMRRGSFDDQKRVAHNKGKSMSVEQKIKISKSKTKLA